MQLTFRREKGNNRGKNCGSWPVTCMCFAKGEKKEHTVNARISLRTVLLPFVSPLRTAFE
jgi:hypothetical protein